MPRFVPSMGLALLALGVAACQRTAPASEPPPRGTGRDAPGLPRAAAPAERAAPSPQGAGDPTAMEEPSPAPVQPIAGPSAATGFAPASPSHGSGAAPPRQRPRGGRGDLEGSGYGAGGFIGHSSAALGSPMPSAPPGNSVGFGTLGGSPSRPAIDPNGRFATTYRPGGGHLAWFEAAMARGGIPSGARELVGDLGARYAPAMAAPTNAALSYRVDLARGALSPSGGPTHLRIALRSSAAQPTGRPPLAVHVVLDCSNSMEGDSIAHARQATAELVGRLAPTDRFSLTTFGGTARVLVGEGLVGPRRAAILTAVAGIGLEGGTNISAGLELGYQESRRGPTGADWVRLVMLLSDGRPNAGETRKEALAAMAANAFQAGVQTSSFGLGQDYDGALMSGIAESGAGGYYYLRDGSGIAPALAAELESRLQPVAQAVEIRVRLRPDVRLTQTYGSRRLNAEEAAGVRAQELAADQQSERRDRIQRNRQVDVEGGMRFFIPGFSRDDQHVILLGIDVPAGVGERPLATVELRYKDRVRRSNAVEETPVRLRYADSDAASAATIDPSVERTVQGFDAGEAMLGAARRVSEGDTAGAQAVLAERAGLLRAAAQALREPRLAEDAARIERFRNLVGGGSELSNALVLALLLDTTGRGMLH